MARRRDFDCRRWRASPVGRQQGGSLLKGGNLQGRRQGLEILGASLGCKAEEANCWQRQAGHEHTGKHTQTDE